VAGVAVVAWVVAGAAEVAVVVAGVAVVAGVVAGVAVVAGVVAGVAEAAVVAVESEAAVVVAGVAEAAVESVAGVLFNRLIISSTSYCLIAPISINLLYFIFDSVFKEEQPSISPLIVVFCFESN
jgi:hypothetical protein